MTNKMKKLFNKLILQFDNHAPIEDYRDDDYEYFFDEYLKPCIDEYNNKDTE